ncbi:MAG TPA: hypothetical protein VIO61_11705 [Anaerolineaceae bacterium]
MRKESIYNHERNSQHTRSKVNEPSTIPSGILAYLTHNQVGSAAEIAAHLRVTLPDIRYHLNILEQENAVIRVHHHNPKSRGRPKIFYRLAPYNPPNAITRLLIAALLSFLDDAQSESLEYRLRLLAEKMVTPIQLSLKGPLRITEVVNQLNTMDFQAHWEARPTGPQIFITNCPYAGLLAALPQLCELDRLMIQALIKMDVQQLTKIELNSTSKSACIFSLTHR